jgi:hypothetical protein
MEYRSMDRLNDMTGGHSQGGEAFASAGITVASGAV